MSWKVLITAAGVNKAGQRAHDLLRQAGCQTVFPPRFGPLKSAELTPLLAETDAVLASLDQYSAAVLNSPAARRLKIIARWGAGYDSVDLAAATQQGIVVTYTPGLLDEAVADYAFALLLALARRVHEGHLAVLANEWTPGWGHDVAGKTLGIVGFGRIGLAVAHRARGFNMRVLAYNPTTKPEAEKLGVKFLSLDDLLTESDFVSLHAALTPRNRGLLGDAQLRRMKPTAYLINTARGALVDESALARALCEGRLAGAALDVFMTEPLPADSPLRSAPNLLLSPHQASFACETGERVSSAAAQAIVDLMAGRQPQNVLNPDVFKSPALRTRGVGVSPALFSRVSGEKSEA
jgi:phosphoglycerate dehydrogenase-like enzyme